MPVIMMNEEIDVGRLDSFPFLLSRSVDKYILSGDTPVLSPVVVRLQRS